MIESARDAVLDGHCVAVVGWAMMDTRRLFDLLRDLLEQDGVQINRTSPNEYRTSTGGGIVVASAQDRSERFKGRQLFMYRDHYATECMIDRIRADHARTWDQPPRG